MPSDRDKERTIEVLVEVARSVARDSDVTHPVDIGNQMIIAIESAAITLDVLAHSFPPPNT